MGDLLIVLVLPLAVLALAVLLACVVALWP